MVQVIMVLHGMLLLTQVSQTMLPMLSMAYRYLFDESVPSLYCHHYIYIHIFFMYLYECIYNYIYIYICKNLLLNSYTIFVLIEGLSLFYLLFLIWCLCCCMCICIVFILYFHIEMLVFILLSVFIFS